MKPIFALVDCNNFYASCEKLFRPDLTHAPVVVLSNNDGCVVDKINHSGLGNVLFVSQGTTPQWSMKREHLSSAYTTRWEDLKVVR